MPCAVFAGPNINWVPITVNFERFALFDARQGCWRRLVLSPNISMPSAVPEIIVFGPYKLSPTTSIVAEPSMRADIPLICTFLVLDELLLYIATQS